MFSERKMKVLQQEIGLDKKTKNFNFPIKGSSKSRKFKKKMLKQNYILDSGFESLGLLIRQQRDNKH